MPPRPGDPASTPPAAPAAPAAPDPTQVDGSTFLRALGKRVRLLRVHHELTQDQLADAADMSRSFISLIEHGAHGIDVVRLLRLAAAFGVPLTELLDLAAPLPAGRPLPRVRSAGHDTAAAATRAPSSFPRISTDPDQMGGVPCIRGQRLTVATVVGRIADGATPTELLQDYPDLEPDDIREALHYTTAQLDF